MPRYEIKFDDETDFTIYKVKVRRSHHKNGFKSIQSERISPKDLPRNTLLRLKRKGLANVTKVILP